MLPPAFYQFPPILLPTWDFAGFHDWPFLITQGT